MDRGLPGAKCGGGGRTLGNIWHPLTLCPLSRRELGQIASWVKNERMQGIVYLPETSQAYYQAYYQAHKAEKQAYRQAHQAEIQAYRQAHQAEIQVYYQA